MSVIFDGPDTAIVDVPHGRYTVTRRQPSTHWHLTAVPEGETVDTGRFAGLEVTNAGRVQGLRYGSGRPQLELVDVLVLAAMAFRRRDEDQLRKAG